MDEAIAAGGDDPGLHLHLGVTLWDKESKEKALPHFILSAKLNPSDPLPFKYLGHYYSCGDPNRAINCYQRSISLSPDDSDCGDSLCNLLHSQSLQLSVCTQASQASPRAFWAFRRLGFLHLHHHRWSDAVPPLQHSIRGYPTSPDLWEALGLAYSRLGMFTAANKSYGRAIELDDTRIFAMIESANIFLMLGSFTKGVEQFRRALEISPQNVSAKYGLASGLLSLSKECMNLGAFRWGASLLEDACKVADANTQFAGNHSSVWKLHGDIQLTYSKCHPWIQEDHDVKPDGQAFRASILSWKQTCHSAAISAKRSYQRALHLAPWQANLYLDIAITSDTISSFNEDYGGDQKPWQLSEKMALGALLLEGDNHEFWVTLGCLSGHNVLQQHALIRALQLDVSLAVAWAYLGKLYREEGEKKLARQAFDSARSIDPSLALPWAGMAAETHSRDLATDDAFESCLRAVQILPLAEFQLGLANLALLSGNLTSPQVLGAIQQAVQRGPHHPESHNLCGLVCEARSQYQAAVASYRLARCAIGFSSENIPTSYYRDVAVNMARCLSLAGYASDAVNECEDLMKEGRLDAKGMQIYALSLWKLGKNDTALPVIRNLAASVSKMEQPAAAASVSFICRLLYYISGLDAVTTSIQKMPKDLSQSSKVIFIVSAIHALDHSNRLESVVSSCRYLQLSHEEIIGMQCLIALGKLVKNGSEKSLGFRSGVDHLKKAIHFYPTNNLLRNLLGQLLLCSDAWKDSHVASRCCVTADSDSASKFGLKSGCEILGAATVCCNAIGNKLPKYSFPTCGYECSGHGAVQEIQKYLHREPWNNSAQYLLILNLFQKAREERFPMHLCNALERLLFVALSNEYYCSGSALHQYQKFQLLLCVSEISLQGGNQLDCIKHAKEISALQLPNSYLFFAHLMLCRAYATGGSWMKLHEECAACLDLRTEYGVGWIILAFVVSQYNVQMDSITLLSAIGEGSKEWIAIRCLALGLMQLWDHEFSPAEETLAQACSLASTDSCLFLCHGSACMELARKLSSSQFLSLAANSLAKAHANSLTPLPVASLLLAQAEGSLNSKEQWEKNLRDEWYSWAPEMRPAELFFQMHLLARQMKSGSDSSSQVEFCQSPEKWVARAIHTNPSCFRYWKALQKLTE